MTEAREVDYTALTRPITRAQVVDFRRRMRERGERWATSGWAVAFGVTGFTFVGGLVVVVAAAMLWGVISSGDGVNPISIAAVVFAAIVGALLVSTIVRVVGSLTGSWARWMRLFEFAAANGMIYSPSDPSPDYPGAIFGIGDSRQSIDHVRSASGRFFDLGGYRYSTGSGKTRSTHTWGFLALALDRALPHMVLDSRANNGLFGGTNLPAVFAKNQVLSLEGDFDRHFTLYAPKEYETDALYVFTPDLMALLIDEAAPFDVEIIDRWMFVYSSTALDALDPATYRRMFRIIDTVGATTVRHTDRYADDRVGDRAADVVAPQGRRLRHGVSIGAVLIVVVVVAGWLWGVVSDLLGS